jgi:hypothetical protein
VRSLHTTKLFYPHSRTAQAFHMGMALLATAETGNKAIGHIVVVGRPLMLRVTTKVQLARALETRTSPIIIWDIELARPFARLLWAERRQYLAFIDFLTARILQEYGVNVGTEWRVCASHRGEIILTPVDPKDTS